MKKLQILFLFLYICFSAYSQSETDSGNSYVNSINAVENEQITKIKDAFYIVNGFENTLLYGNEYYPYHNRSEAKPLLFTDNNYSSSIFFDGKRYDNITLQYDAYTDEVIYSDLQFFIMNFFNIALNKNLIGWFEFYRFGDTLTFKYLTKKDGAPEDRFYETPYMGSSKFIIRHYTSVTEQVEISEYHLKEAYYLNIGNGFFKFKNKKQFMKIFGKENETIAQIIKDQGFNIKNKQLIINILETYDAFL